MRFVRIPLLFLTLCCAAFAEDDTAPSNTAPNRVTVHVLGLFHPDELVVSASVDQRLFATAARRKVAIGDSLCRQATLVRNGNLVSFRCGELRISSSKIVFAATGGDASFTLSVPGKLRRSYPGKLEIAATNNELVAVVSMDLETAVASIVAAELPTETPFEALKAQAVVTRSFLAASSRRHQEAEFCDTTHCQFLRSPPAAGSAAARATLATRGLVMTWQGKAFPAMYSASCGGTTRTLAQAGYRQRDYPYFAVECSYCRRHIQHGYGPGHGIGLCQHGAAGMAQNGADFRAILAHYFPNTEIKTADQSQDGTPSSF